MPIAPGRWGNLDALAVSPDGRWIAAGGYGAVTSLVADYRMPGFLYSSDLDILSPEQSEEQGLIYLFDATQTERTLVLRGHRGPVVGLVFVNFDGKLRLVSAATEDSKNPRIVLPRVGHRIGPNDASRLTRHRRPAASPKSAPHEIEAWTAHGQQYVAILQLGRRAAGSHAAVAHVQFDERKAGGAGPAALRLVLPALGQRRTGNFCWEPMRPPSVLRGWWDGAAPVLPRIGKLRSDHSITYLRPIDERRVALVVLDNKTRGYELIVRDLKASSRHESDVNPARPLAESPRGGFEGRFSGGGRQSASRDRDLSAETG